MSTIKATDATNVTMELATGSDTGILVAIGEWWQYDENRKPSKIIGTRYIVHAPKKRHKEFIVKIQAPPVFTQEQIDDANGIMVRFKDFSGKYYNASDGSCPLSATASTIEIVGGTKA